MRITVHVYFASVSLLVLRAFPMLVRLHPTPYAIKDILKFIASPNQDSTRPDPTLRHPVPEYIQLGNSQNHY